MELQICPQNCLGENAKDCSWDKKLNFFKVGKWDPKRYLGRVFFTKNSKFRKIFWYTHQMIMKVGAFESPDQGGPSRYPEHMSSTPRKFFTDFWKSTLSNFLNWNVRRKFKRIEHVDFQSALQTFLGVENVCHGYRQGPIRSELSNAPIFMFMRRISRKLSSIYKFSGKNTCWMFFESHFLISESQNVYLPSFSNKVFLRKSRI